MTRGLRIALGFVLANFAALTAYTIHRYGVAESLAMCFANAATVTLFVDACIALGLITMWMWQDARAHGRSWLPYALLTIATGSVGPLLYLVTGHRAGTGAHASDGSLAA
jgi:hypothetical protein